MEPGPSEPRTLARRGEAESVFITDAHLNLEFQMFYTERLHQYFIKYASLCVELPANRMCEAKVLRVTSAAGSAVPVGPSGKPTKAAVHWMEVKVGR